MQHPQDLSALDIGYRIRRTRLDEHYQPAEHTRLTTNFANLARGELRQQNLRTALSMMNARFNQLVYWDNPHADRYSLALDIVSVDLHIQGAAEPFPSIEVLQTRIVDEKTQTELSGVLGNNFSSYVRDYDFSVRLVEFNQPALHSASEDPAGTQAHVAQPQSTGFRVPEDFGELHGQLFQRFIHSALYRQHFQKLPVICLSVSDNKVYERRDNQHPILGVEYVPTEASLTEQYFQKMGLQVRYFMPPASVAPLAFYFIGDLLNDYTNLELASTISTMETFQKIYRPEIYNAHAVAGPRYSPRLASAAYAPTAVVYDREERSRLAVQQGQYADLHLIRPYQQILARWAAQPTHSDQHRS